MQSTLIIQILLSGFIAGIIIFQSAIAAPIVFSSLKPDQSRIFIRSVFPKIFRLLFLIGLLMMGLNIFFGAKHQIQYFVSLLTFILPLICVVIVPATNRATDTNNQKGFSTDFIGQNWNYPEASYEEREKIVDLHRQYQQGLMWTLAYHPRIPKKVRDKVSIWGTCKDEYTREDGWQNQL